MNNFEYFQLIYSLISIFEIELSFYLFNPRLSKCRDIADVSIHFQWERSHKVVPLWYISLVPCCVNYFGTIYRCAY